MAGPGGALGVERPAWTYSALQEGTLGIEPSEFTDSQGGFPAVTHVDSAALLYDDITGELITDGRKRPPRSSGGYSWVA